MPLLLISLPFLIGRPFEWRYRLVALFVGGNLAVTQGALVSGRLFDGTGYLIAASIGAAIALLFLRDRLKRLEYLTFMLQPLTTAA